MVQFRGQRVDASLKFARLQSLLTKVPVEVSDGSLDHPQAEDEEVSEVARTMSFASRLVADGPSSWLDVMASSIIWICPDARSAMSSHAARTSSGRL